MTKQVVCEKEFSKDTVINALIEMNIFKMPDGRQLYQVPTDELVEQYRTQKQFY